MSEPETVQTAFTLVVNLDGSLSAYIDAVPDVVRQRTATLDDLEMYSSHLARSAGRALLVQSMAPLHETTADRVSAALAKRDTSRARTKPTP